MNDRIDSEIDIPEGIERVAQPNTFNSLAEMDQETKLRIYRWRFCMENDDIPAFTLPFYGPGPRMSIREYFAETLETQRIVDSLDFNLDDEMRLSKGEYKELYTCIKNKRYIPVNMEVTLEG